MYLDFAAALIFIICIIRGEKKGVIESFASAFGWLFSLFFTFLYSPVLAEYITENTHAKQLMSDFAMKHVKTLLPETAASSGAAASDLPSSLSSAIANSANAHLEQLARPVADRLAETIISVAAFFLLIIAVKFVVHFIENLIKKFHRAKVVGTADSILGMLFGIVKGGVLIYLLMTVLILTAACVTFEPLTKTLQSSVVVDFVQSRDLLFFGEDVIDGIQLPESEIPQTGQKDV